MSPTYLPILTSAVPRQVLHPSSLVWLRNTHYLQLLQSIHSLEDAVPLALPAQPSDLLQFMSLSSYFFYSLTGKEVFVSMWNGNNLNSQAGISLLWDHDFSWMALVPLMFAALLWTIHPQPNHSPLRYSVVLRLPTWHCSHFQHGSQHDFLFCPCFTGATCWQTTFWNSGVQTSSKDLTYCTPRFSFIRWSPSWYLKGKMVTLTQPWVTWN